MNEKEIKIELVTETTTSNYQAICDKAHDEEEALWFMNGGWYAPDETKNSWNTERYIIWKCNTNGVKDKVIGYFSITKYHQHRRASVDGFYILPEFRQKDIPKHVVLFVGNKVFGELGFNSVTASAWSSNERVIKLYDSLMIRRGIEKEYYYYKRKYHDKIVWGMNYNESIYVGKVKLVMDELIKYLGNDDNK